MILNEVYELSNGVKIPKLGLGTWFIPDEQAAEAVRQAVKAGYRHFDTAQAYGNEAGIGEGARSCSVPREELLLPARLRQNTNLMKQRRNPLTIRLKKWVWNILI